jgi:pyridoxal phosphate enzyme (YggS family)
MVSIADNLQAVRDRIGAAALACGRAPASVSLLAVSKTWPAGSIAEAHAAGQHSFGENYVQELVAKAQALSSLAIEWHFIGPLQANKTQSVAACAHWVHSLDRLKIALRLDAQRAAGLGPLDVCVQVNVSGEASKSGCAPGEALALCRAVAALPRLRLRGLMCIPEPTADVAQQRAAFRSLRQVFERVRGEGMPIDTLSMGMSHDLEAAIAEGATIVRVGTAIFGERRPPATEQGDR